jgi:serine/threonine protein kinase
VKPGNILFKNVGKIKIWKITDFGVSSKKDSKLKTTVNQTNTQAYASIE